MKAIKGFPLSYGVVHLIGFADSKFWINLDKQLRN